MPNLISGDRLRKAVEDEAFIIGGDPKSVENVKYDFHMGDRVLKAAYAQPVDFAELPQASRFVEPGEAVFVLTKERLNLPNNIMATLSPKRKIAHGGIIILGGLAIDPLYRGFLVVGLYNFSSTPFPLQPGKKLIAGLFYELDDVSIDLDNIAPLEISDFPDELLALIRNYKPIEINGLEGQVQKISIELTNLRSELSSDKIWRDDFKKGLDAHNTQIEKLLKALEEEKINREKGDEKIGDKLDKMSNSFYGLGLLTRSAIALLLIALGAITTIYFPKWFGAPDHPNPPANVSSIQPPPTTRSPQ